MQYNAVKERYPDHVVLFQVGDFYELYGEDAKALAPELGLTLTTRPVPGLAEWKCAAFPLTGWSTTPTGCGATMMSLFPPCPQGQRSAVKQSWSGSAAPAGIRFPWAVRSTSAQNPMRCSLLGKLPSRFTTRNFRCSPQEFPRADFDRKLEENPLNEQYFLPDMPQEQAQPTDTRDYSGNYRLLDRCAPTVSIFWEKAIETRSTYGPEMCPHRSTKCGSCTMLCPKNRTGLTREQIEDYADRMAARYQVAVYHHFENGFDERLDYQPWKKRSEWPRGMWTAPWRMMAFVMTVLLSMT